jgi:hypothetical protein
VLVEKLNLGIIKEARRVKIVSFFVNVAGLGATGIDRSLAA